MPRRTMIAIKVKKKAIMTRIPLFQERRRGAEDAAGADVGLEEGCSAVMLSFGSGADSGRGGDGGGLLARLPCTVVRRVVVVVVVLVESFGSV